MGVSLKKLTVQTAPIFHEKQAFITTIIGLSDKLIIKFIILCEVK